ncbi:MAG: methylated-DNA--[Clostridia bacterium]|nr:methylated-DNA--[protein]-cysteine S-methyltransferase [Clostridia bacterium]
MYIKYIDSPIGILRIDSDGRAITEVATVACRGSVENADTLCEDMTKWLQAYFSGACAPCGVPLDPIGTEFQRKIWSTLLDLPYGVTATYGEVALRAGFPKACRAVGSAVGKNPILVAIPCHRVLSSKGLGGFTALGGVETKKKLLKLENVI